MDFEQFKKGVKLFKKIDCTFELMEKMAKVKANLYMKLGFWGGLIVALEIYPTDEIEQFAADYRHLYFNPKFIEQHDERTIRGMVFHSLIHLAFRHIQRISNREQEIWGTATEMNSDLLSKESFEDYNRFKKSITRTLQMNIKDTNYIKPKFHQKTSDEMYKMLMDEVQEQEASGSVGIAPSNVSNDNKGEWSCNVTEVNEKYTDMVNPIVAEMEQRRFDGIMQNSYEREKSRGTLPASIQELINAINEEPKIDWKTILYKFVQFIIAVDFSWSRPSKSMLANGIISPGVIKNNIYVVIAIDTSGSVGQKELTDFLTETHAILMTFGANIKVILIDCDAKVQNVETIEYGEGLHYDVTDKTWYGRGGTRFEPVFEWIDEKVEDGEIEQPQVLLYFTDTHGSYPNEAPDYQTVWISTEPEERMSTPPFGEIIVYEEE